MQEGGKAQGDQYARRRAGCLMSSAGDLVDDWCKALGGSARPHLLCLDEAALSAMGRGAPTEVARAPSSSSSSVGSLSRTNSSASGSSGSHTGPRTTAKTEAASTFKAALRAASVGALPPVSGRAAASVSDTVAEAKPDDLNDLNRTASETAVELAQTASSELAKPEPCSVAAIQTASGTGVEPAKTSASEPAKPEPFSMAAMMERARRKAQEKREEDEARARGETFHRAPSNEDSAMDAHLRTHKERQNDLQNRLKGLTKSLKRFDVRAAEAEIEHERVRQQARATAAQMWKGLNGAKVKKACAFDLAPPDMIMKILSFLSGPKLFITLSTSRRFQCLDAEFWIELISREHADPIPLEPLSTRQLREIYRDKAERWSRLMCTYDWLKKQGCPSDVHGARKGPWSKVTLSHVLQDTVACTGHQAAIWRRRAIMPYLRCITCLVGSSHEGIRVLAASALANLVRHSDCGRDVLDKHAVMKPLQTMLYSNSLGQQKQATRAMINAWVDDEVAVRVGCDASYLNAPFRHTPSTGVRNVEWLCIDFSPSGKMNPAYTISMSTQYGADSAVGRLQGHGEDSMGQFKICEATLNRSLQWMSGTCLDNDDRFQAGLCWRVHTKEYTRVYCMNISGAGQKSPAVHDAKSGCCLGVLSRASRWHGCVGVGLRG